jgi:hypothetical protein
MALKYTLVASVDLRPSIPTAEARALEYLVCGVGALPAMLPAHTFFELPESRAPLGTAYTHCSPSEFELSLRAPPSEPHRVPPGYSVALRLPYLRLEDTHACFEFLGWLSTLVAPDGFIGTLHTAGPDSAPTLLFAYGGALHWGAYQGRPVPYRTDTNNAAPFLGP